MANFVTSPNMNLTIPVTGQEAGPNWANDINNSLSVIDSHNHSSGSGVQIGPDGININSALPFNSNQATGLAFVNIAAQGSGIPSPTNQSLYVSGVDLYYKDGNGVPVRMTSGGGTVTGASSIVSGTASAAFVSSTLVVLQNVGVAAPIDAASYILRYNGGYPSPAGNAIVLAAPSALSGVYQYTLPATYPSSTSFLTMSTSGTIANTISTTQGITRSMQAAVGQQISSSCGSFFTTSTTYTPVTNLSVSITTTGRPVVLMLMSDGSSNISSVGCGTSGGGSSIIYFAFYRGASQISQSLVGVTLAADTSIYEPPSSVQFIDTPTAGTYTYSLKVLTSATSFGFLNFCVLVAYEL